MNCRIALSLAVAAPLWTAPALFGQPARLPGPQPPNKVDSGPVENLAARDPFGHEPAVIFASRVHVPDAAWLRLSFAEAILSGDVATGTGSYLMITSLEDGYWQRLDAEHLGYWSNTSAYFNGDAVLVELWAYPGTGVNRIAVSEVITGEPAQPVEGLCDNSDQRMPFSDPAVARRVPDAMGTGPGLATAWLANHGGSANRFLTCGHCIAPNPATTPVVQFNVPHSSATGVRRNPPPEYQYPIQVSSIQSNFGNTNQWNDYATFQVFPNSNTGLAPRVAQRAAIFPLTFGVPNPNNTPVRVNGYGVADNTVIPSIPPEWSRTGKTSEGRYTIRDGNALGFRADVSSGDSGGPLVLDNGWAIGIVGYGGCSNPLQNANVANAVDHPGLLAYLANPQGTSIPYVAPNCLSTLFNSNNQGSIGGAVYFDVAVGAQPLEIWGLDLNISNSSTPGGTYTVDVYITAGGRAGKMTSSEQWTRVASGTGIVNPRDSISRIVLPYPFRLVQGARYGVALVLTGAGHAYTNGNDTFNNAHLTIETGHASNGPWGLGGQRTWNGGFCYNTLPASGQCIQTLFDSNNAGNIGGAVYFDIATDPYVPTVRVTEFKINTTAAPLTPLTVDVYEHPGTWKQNVMSPNWVKIGTASGLSAGPDNPTTMRFDDDPIWSFHAGGSVGIAMVLIGGAHAYTNGTGFNEVSWNTALRITAGGATNVPFTGTIFETRVWNGELCYIMGTGQCTQGDTAFRQAPPDQALPSRVSNAPGVSLLSDQQIADDFVLDARSTITGLKLWAVYGDETTPHSQDFIINIYENQDNNPGPLLCTVPVNNVQPIDTGLAAGTRPLYEFHLDLPEPCTVEAGGRYWLSPLGNTPGASWSWQFFESGGERRSRPDAGAAWNTFAGNLAMEICSTMCYANCDGSTSEPILTVDDFTCFINAFAAAGMLAHEEQIVHYANCDGSTTTPVLTVDDFTCFINAFAEGCK